MDSDDTTDDRGRNLMHKTNDEICIGENAKVTQHDPDFENAYVVMMKRILKHLIDLFLL